MLDLSKYIFIDNHAHSLLKRHMELDAFGFRQCFSESRSRELLTEHVPNSVHYMDMINKMNKILVTDDEESLITIRSRQQEAGYVRTLWDDVSLGAVIVDTGFRSDDMISTAQLSAISQRPIYHCRRIEAVMQSTLDDKAVKTFDDFNQMFVQRLFEPAESQLVSLKTIAAYRGGLQIDLSVSLKDAEKDFARLKKSWKSGDRITACPFYHYWLVQSFELAACHSLPVQVHCGIGDDDAALSQSNPLLMQSLFKTQTLEKTAFVLLHCYPFAREAGYLTSLYPNVYMDLSLSMTLASASAKTIIREALAIAPSTKLLAGTDGHSCPEMHWYGALTWKKALSLVLTNLITEEMITEHQATNIAASILHGNAKRLYKLEGMA